MVKARLLALLGAFVVGLAPMSCAFAAPITVPVVKDPAGNPIKTTPVITVDQSGNYVAGGGGGGGSLAAKANASSQSSTEGATADPISMDLHRSLRVLNMDASGNPIDPTAALPAGANVIGKAGLTNTSSTPINPAILEKQCQPDANGACAVPETAGPTVTKTTLAANTSTSVCPAATHGMTTEIYLAAGASIGLGLKAQSLTTDAWGTGSTAADIVVSTVGAEYIAPVGYSSAITARSTGTPSVTCIQTVRP